MVATLLREITCLHHRLNWRARGREMSVPLFCEVTCLHPRLNWRARGREMSVTLLREVTCLHPRQYCTEPKVQAVLLLNLRGHSEAIG